MKAFLVVDFPNDVDVTDLRMVYIIGDSDGIVVKVQRELIPCLKPMPLKRRSYVLWGTDPDELDYKTAKFISTHEVTEYDKGWNDCVELLEGDGQNE